MSRGGANVDSIDAIRAFRVALIKFAESANAALGDAEAEMHRTLGWLERDQLTHWTGQIRKRTDALSKAKDALRTKKLFDRRADGTPAPAIEEEKAVAVATRRLAEAEQKLINTKRHARKLQKEIMLYKGGVQRLTTTIHGELPVTVARIDKMAAALEGYVALAPSAELATHGSGELAVTGDASPDSAPTEKPPAG